MFVNSIIYVTDVFIVIFTENCVFFLCILTLFFQFLLLSLLALQGN